MRASGDVRFDWDGSLELARRLWAYADQLDALRVARDRAADDLVRSWRGGLLAELTTRLADDSAGLDLAAARLREGALQWADAWRQAVDQQNRVLYARACERARADRGLVDRAIGFFVGHDDLPSPPAPRDAPRPPHFVPFRGFARY